MLNKELKETLIDHKKWLENKPDGRRADLIRANLRGADLIRANLIRANLSGANLSGADLREACTDFSSWPLWCGAIGVSIDDETAAQLLYHALCNLSEEQKRAVLKDPIGFANTFHRVQIDDVPVIAGIKEHKQ